MSSALSALKRYWPSILPGIVGLWAVYGTQVQAYVSAHPAISAGIGMGYAIFAHLLPSPVSQS